MLLDIEEVITCATILNEGKLILYPTDTIWGIGCDATNERAVKKIFRLKQREDAKSMIILISARMDINTYVSDVDPEIASYLSKTEKPTTAIYNHGKNVAPALINKDGSLAIRITADEFCSALINQLNKPIVSTSANISGNVSPANFMEVDIAVKNGVDYTVQHRKNDKKISQPSSIIKLNEQGKITIIRP